MTQRTFVFAILVNLAACTAAQAEAPEPVQHRFLKAGFGAKEIAIVDLDGDIEWSTPCIGETSDAWLLPDGGVVFSYDHWGENRRAASRNLPVSFPSEGGVIRMDRDETVLWKYVAPEGRSNHSCQPLPDGGFLLGTCSKDACYMIEIDKDGEFVKEVTLQGIEIADMTHTFRQVRKTPTGAYLATNMRENTTYEWSAEGELIRTFPNGVYVAMRLPNGNTLTSGRPGETGAVVEFDGNGDIVWEFTADDAKRLDIRLGMTCGIQRLPNGNTVISSIRHKPYIGEENDDKFVKLIELTRDKQLVWKVTAPSLNNTGVFQILDAPGDVYQGDVLR